MPKPFHWATTTPIRMSKIMKNLMHHHPSEDVRAACVRLADALCSWERSTGRDNIVIIKDTAGFEYRALSGSPLTDDIPDSHILDGFENLKKEQPPTL